MTAVRKYPLSEYLTMAIGWMMLAGVLCQILNPTDAAVTLFGFVMAEFSSRIIVIGFERSQETIAGLHAWDEALGRVLLRWVMFTIGLLIMTRYHENWFFEHHQYAFICVLGLCLILALIRLICTFSAVIQNRISLVVQIRNSILAVSIYCVAQFATLNSDMALSLALALLLGVLALVSLGIRHPIQKSQNGKINSVQSELTIMCFASLIWRYADLIVLALLLSPQNTLIYLIARGLAQVVPVTLNILTDRVDGPLRSAHCAGNLRHFAATAARINLGFLLIGGSVSLGALSMGAYVALIFNLDTAAFRYTLFWLVTAQSAPILFGATCVLFNITQCKSGTILLPLLGVFLFLCSSVLMEVNDPLSLAQIFALTHLMIGAGSALLINLRFGIWPGITAILFRQLKLL
ncbi:MAG: hypothetical protein ACSHWS_08235 [Sulfitobacter sp.]